MSIWGIVPAREGSKGVPGKNLRTIGGVSLLERAIASGLEAGLDGVFVASDGEIIRNVASEAGAMVGEARPPQISGDKSHMFEVYKFALGQILQVDAALQGFVALLPTNPFRNVATVAACADRLAKGADWVFTISEFEHHPYRAMRKISSQRIEPQFPLSADVLWANRQELPKMYRFNGVCIGGNISNLSGDEYNIDGLGTFETEVEYVETNQFEAFDIDTELDLRVAEALFTHHQTGDET